MNAATRQKLTQLKKVAATPCSTEVPTWIRELLIANVTELLEKDASNHAVVNQLIGGLRAITDASVLSDDDPIVSRIVATIDVAESSTG